MVRFIGISIKLNLYIDSIFNLTALPKLLQNEQGIKGQIAIIKIISHIMIKFKILTVN